MSESVTLSSPAKINLWLRILGRREDGYHGVDTRLVRTTVTDEVTVKFARGRDSLSLSCSDPDVPADETNLAARALRAFQRRVGGEGVWRIHLEKVIPAGAGLGGGSGNAAAVLRAANQLTGTPLDQAALLDLAAEIGSDVAFFLLDAAVADGEGRGEKVTAASLDLPMALVLIKPPFSVSTPWAYGRWSDSRELEGVLYAPQITPWGVMVNDLERPVFEKYLLLPTLKMWLLSQPECAAALMSGSGSTIFAITRGISNAAELAGRVQHYCGETTWVRVTELA